MRLGARPLLCPLPCVLASSGEADGRRGFAAAAWTGVVNSEPPMVYVALRPSRHTFGLVRETGAFGLNVPPAALVEQTRLVDKALSRRVKQELMPFALECSGIQDFEALHAALVELVNRVGLVVSRDTGGAVRALLRAAGRPVETGAIAKVARGVREVEDLLRFSISETHFELRQRLGGE